MLKKWFLHADEYIKSDCVVCLDNCMLTICLFSPQRWYMSTCLQCFQMCCTVRESHSPSVWLCCSMTKSLCPQNCLLLLIPPSYTFISITPSGYHSSARRNWSVFDGAKRLFDTG